MDKPSDSEALGVARPPRTLSKSDFKLARTCEAKLYFRENKYPDSRESNPYLAMLAGGGYMVEALAKARYVDGVVLEYGRNIADEFARTVELLARESVTLFEGTFLAGRRQARPDILDKKGTVFRLLEVKASLFDGAKHDADRKEGKPGVFRTSKKPFRVRAEWREYLEDITFQVLLLERVLPGVEIHPHLVLLDESKRSGLDNVPQFFDLVRHDRGVGVSRLHTAQYSGSQVQLLQLDLLTEVDVSAEVEMLRAEVEAAAAQFEARLDSPLAVHLSGLQRGSKCGKCEFRAVTSAGTSGFADCWGPLAEPSPHILELYSVGTAKALDREPLVTSMFNVGKASLFDIPEECLVTADGTVGPTAERQRRQIKYTRENEVFVAPSLQSKIAALQGPLYFLDFETSRLALPYHAKMRPYGLVTFQWSCHTVTQPGAAPRHLEWLNNVDVWPNQSFAESLRSSIGDTGPVLTWSHFEASTLQEVVRDLATFGRNEPELVAWLRDVFENRIVDLHEWAKYDYYNPRMRGRTSIKVVLDALWLMDEAMRGQYEAWTGQPPPSGDPYAALPPIEISGIQQDVHEGTGAMRAYEEMMYGAERHDAEVTKKWAALLQRYCALDTLSMVLIFEHWRRLAGKA